MQTLKFKMSSRHFSDDEFNIPDSVRDDVRAMIQYCQEESLSTGETFTLKRGNNIVARVKPSGRIEWENKSWEYEYNKIMKAIDDWVDE